MDNLTPNTSFISQRLALNLNMSDVSPQSKLGLLIEGLYKDRDLVNSSLENNLNNMFINTANEIYLDLMGSQEAIYRVKEPLLRIPKSYSIIKLYAVKNSTNVTLKAGETIELVPSYLYGTLIEDIDLSTITTTGSYIGLDISGVSGTSTINVSDSSSFRVEVNNHEFRIEFNKSLNIPVVLESLSNFRSRLLFSRNIPKQGSDSSIRLAIASSESVHDYSIDYLTNPFKVLIFNRNMMSDDNVREDLNTYVIPIIETQINLRKSEGSSFEIGLPKRVTFSLKLVKSISNSADAPYSVYNYIDYIKNNYKLGKKIEISIDSIKQYLQTLGENSDILSNYSLEVYKIFNNIEYKSANNTITIDIDEYPYPVSLEVI